MKTIRVTLLILSVLGSAGAALAADDMNIRFSADRDYRVEVQPSLTGSDIYLLGRDRINLSRRFPGENLFPAVDSRGNHFLISWIHYRRGDVRLCLYDSAAGSARMYAFSGFDFVGMPLVLRRENIPRALVFIAGRNGKDDLYFLEIDGDEPVNFSRSAENEKTVKVLSTGSTFRIESQTLYHRDIYHVRLDPLNAHRAQRNPIERPQPESAPAFNARTLNTLVGFGDSIVWGKMRMDELTGEYHPELTFLAQLQNHFNDQYGVTYTVNLGEPATTTYDAVARIDAEFPDNPGYFCLILYGTNDVAHNAFSASGSAENLEWICLRARDAYGMFPVISTVPPQKRFLEGVEYFREQTQDLNNRIVQMANLNNIPYIDSYSAFFDHELGWEACLEDTKGNHPSPLGHHVMATLFAPRVLAALPEKPANVAINATAVNLVEASWDENLEFDFSHYLIEFGYSPDLLDRVTTSESNSFIFYLPAGMPYQRSQLYFRLASVDQAENSSAFGEIISAGFTGDE